MKPSASQAAKDKSGRKRKVDGADAATMEARKNNRERQARFQERKRAGKPGAPK